MDKTNRLKLLDQLLLLSFIAFFISMLCCLRAVTSISLALILIISLLRNKNETGAWLNKNLFHPFIISCGLFYLLQIAGYLYDYNAHSLKAIQLKSALVFVPMALCSSSYIQQHSGKLAKAFVLVSAIAMLYCISMASYKYFFVCAPAEIFFYYKLMLPFKHHAVQVSIIIFAAFIYLLNRIAYSNYLFSKSVDLLTLLFFAGCILLLASKLVIVFSAACLLYYFFFILRKKLAAIYTFTELSALLITLVLIVSTRNEISDRFKDLRNGDLSLIRQKSFDPGIYFNGVQFRLLQLRFVNEILTENKSWFSGVSSRSQELLDQKYKSTHMYVGDGKSNDRGFLSYNTHNQFLESLLESGIAGLLLFLLICISMVRLAFLVKRKDLTMLVILLLIYCLNESVFETQYGIILFTFFPLFYYLMGRPVTSSDLLPTAS